MIKIQNTRTLNGKLVADAELVLVKVNGKDAWFFKDKDGKPQHHDGYGGEPRDYYKPILISRTERIEVSDWFYSTEFNTIDQLASNGVIDRTKCFKILALSEHFSPKHLQDIVDGKLKEGKLVIECEFINYPYPEKHPERMFDRMSIIKLNPHITIYPVEEKMYTKKEIANYIQQFSETAMAHGRLFLTNWDQWFEQNVK